MPLVLSFFFHMSLVVALHFGAPFIMSPQKTLTAEDYVEVEFISEKSSEQESDAKENAGKTPKKMVPKNTSSSPIKKPVSPALLDKEQIKETMTAPTPPESVVRDISPQDMVPAINDKTVPAAPSIGRIAKKPEPPPKPKPEKKEKPPEKPSEKPPENSFDTLLKNLNPNAPDKPVQGKIDGDVVRESDKISEEQKNTRRISSNELRALINQLGNCWNIPAGAKYAENLSVKLQIFVNPDRTVRDVQVIDMIRYETDPYFKAAADSAVRAVYSPACSPLLLPQDGYEQWKSIVVNFNPEEMLQ